MLLCSCLFLTCLLSKFWGLFLFVIDGLINGLICIMNITVGCIIGINDVKVSFHVIGRGLRMSLMSLMQVLMFWIYLRNLMHIGRLIDRLLVNWIGGMLLLGIISIGCLYLVVFYCWYTILCKGWNLILIGGCILLRYLCWQKIERVFYSKSSFILNFTIDFLN